MSRHPLLPTLLPILLLATLLAGCKKEPAGFMIDGGNHSLTVERNKPYFWSGGWELDLIVTRYPECQRRHSLKKASEKVRVDLYRTSTGAFILNQGKRWYVTETQECRAQQFDKAPPNPGDYLGTFRVKNDRFQFVPAKDDKNSQGG